MEHFYPVSTVTEGQGLNITVQSYRDHLDFGLVSCRELVPDLWDLMGYLADSLDELLESAQALSAPEEAEVTREGETDVHTEEHADPANPERPAAERGAAERGAAATPA